MIHALRTLVFAILQVDAFWRMGSTPVARQHVLKDSGRYLLLGVLIPLSLAIILEVRVALHSEGSL